MSLKTLLITLITLTMLATLWTLFSRSPKITNFPTAGTTIVAFGDSLTEGVGTTQENDYVSLLSQRMGEPIINMGVSGDTTGDGLERLDSVFPVDPKVVIVLLGGNDTLKRVPVETTYTNLDSIIKQITGKGIGVVLVGAPGGLYGGRYDDMYETLAKKHGVAFVPNILKGILSRPELMSDSIHPNDAGHVIIADRIEPLLRQVLTGPQ